MNFKTIKTNSYTLNTIKTSKFKTNRILFSFANSLEETTVTNRSILPYLLKAISKKYDTRRKISSYLDNMYAASFNVGASKLAKTHFINLDFSFINDQYTLNNELLFNEMINFIKEIIFNPLFKEDILNEEKRLIKEYYQSIYNDKLKYAVLEHNKAMFQNETYSISALGKEEDLQNITLDSCHETYKKMLNTDLITITVIGDIDVESVEQLFENTFKFNSRDFVPTLIDYETKEIKKVTEIIKEIDVNQAKLVIGYRLDVRYLDKEYYSGIIFNTIFGGNSESLLFKEIRDEKGLVYFINSGYDPYKGVIYITSGINKSDYLDVMTIIDGIVDKIIDMQFDDSVLETAKIMSTNGLIESLDSNYSLAVRLKRNSLFNKEFNLNEIIENINSVTKEEISSIAKKLVKDTVFLLRDDKNDKT